MIHRLVDAPEIKPSRHGLVESANIVTDGSGTWEGGASFSPNGCYELGGTQANCPPVQKPDLQTCVTTATFMPYVLSLGLDWAAADRGYDVKDLAVKHLEVGTSAMLERLIASGTTPPAASPNPLLSGGTSVGAAGTARYTIGRIEAALLAANNDNTGAGGVLYMGPVAAALAAEALCEEDGRLYTKTCNNLVVVGNFPADTVYGHIGQVDVYLGDIFVNDNDDAYRRNVRELMAERLALVLWNPCAVYKGTITAS